MAGYISNLFLNFPFSSLFFNVTNEVDTWIVFVIYTGVCVNDTALTNPFLIKSNYSIFKRSILIINKEHIAQTMYMDQLVLNQHYLPCRITFAAQAFHLVKVRVASVSFLKKHHQQRHPNRQNRTPQWGTNITGGNNQVKITHYSSLDILDAPLHRNGLSSAGQDVSLRIKYIKYPPPRLLLKS